MRRPTGGSPATCRSLNRRRSRIDSSTLTGREEGCRWFEPRVPSADNSQRAEACSRAGGSWVAEQRRVLRVAFFSAEEFQLEYASNLEHGGVFIANEEAASPREPVLVEMLLTGCPQTIRLEGEVVHIVPPEMAEAGGVPGVAVQLCCTQTALRAALEPFVKAAGEPPHQKPDSGRRRAPRAPAQVPIRIEAPGKSIIGHSRNLSQVGVLVSVHGDELPVGTRIQISIEHPTGDESFQVGATVTRQLANDEGVMALAVEFDPNEEQRDGLRHFISDLQSHEHTRRLGGIHGSITEGGPDSLIQMLGQTAPIGTLTITRGDEEAIVGFEAGMLQYVRLGTVTGLKALARLLDWTEGSFEFHARLEPVAFSDVETALETAVFQALIKRDELRGLDRGALSMQDPLRFVTRPVGPGGESLSKCEETVLTLAGDGLSVGRIVDLIPEPDVDVLRAIMFLIDLGSLALPPR